MKLQNFLFVVLLLSLVSCGSDSFENPGKKVQYYPVKLVDGDGWSFIGSDGKIYCKDKFENEPTCVVNDIFSVEEDDGYTVYRFDDKPKAIKGLEGLKEVSFANEGLIGIVRPNERISFVDTDGNTKFVLDPIDGKEIVEACGMITEGLIAVRNADGKWGFVDTNGKVAIKLKYDQVVPVFSGGLTFAMKETDDETQTYIINTKGEEVCKLKSGYSPVFPFLDGKAIVQSYEESRYAIVDTKGELTKLDKKVEDVIDFNSNTIIYTDSLFMRGIMSLSGEVLVRPRYDRISFIDDGTFLAKKDDKYSIIDKNGDKMDIDLSDYEELEVLTGEGFAMYGGEELEYYLIDKEGKKIGKEEFSDIGTNIAQDIFLSSDYVDIDVLAGEISALITGDGVGKYSFGESPSYYLSDPDDYKYADSFSPDDQPKSKSNYYLTYYIDTDSYIAGSRWNDFTYEYETYFVPYCRIIGGTIDVSSSADIYSDVAEKLVKLLKNKGFDLVSSDSGDKELKSGSCSVEISRDSPGDLRVIVRELTPELVEVPADNDSGYYAPADSVAVN